MAHLLGIRSPLKAVPSIALGSLEVTPLDLTSVYATLAAGGVYRPPRAVRRVRDSEDELVGNFTEPDHRRAVPDGVASVVTGILEKNMVSGTGTRAHLDDGRPEAGKTGTTSDYADAWFCGYTPDLATCVWVGYPKGRITMQNIEGQGVVSGPTLPAQIWHDYMTTALENVPPSDFPPPVHPAELQPYPRLNSSGPGSSTPYVAPPPPPAEHHHDSHDAPRDRRRPGRRPRRARRPQRARRPRRARRPPATDRGCRRRSSRPTRPVPCCSRRATRCRPSASRRDPAIVGRVLAEPVRAALDLPPFPSSAMDGYAVRARDAGAPLDGCLPRRRRGRPAARSRREAQQASRRAGSSRTEPMRSSPSSARSSATALVTFEGDVHEGDHVRQPG